MVAALLTTINHLLTSILILEDIADYPNFVFLDLYLDLRFGYIHGLKLNN